MGVTYLDIWSSLIQIFMILYLRFLVDLNFDWEEISDTQDNVGAVVFQILRSSSKLRVEVLTLFSVVDTFILRPFQFE